MSQPLKRISRLVACGLFVASLCGCVSTRERLLDSDTSQLQLRSIQSRAFETTDQMKTLRTVMLTLQDLGFVLTSAESGVGSVTASKRNRGLMIITVSVRPRGETQMLVRANCQIDKEPVYDPVPYQMFFSALAKAMFLEAHEVE
jgi:hypothetical protein